FGLIMGSPGMEWTVIHRLRLAVSEVFVEDSASFNTTGGRRMKAVARYCLVGAFAMSVYGVILSGQGIQYDKIQIKTEKIAPNLYMLSGSENVDPGHPDGAGGRIGVLAGPDGIFMVDSQYLQIGDKVLA